MTGINLDQEDEERTRQFLDSLKDGAFDFILSVAADCQTKDWQDPARTGMRQWLQRKSPALAADGALPFAEHFHASLMDHLEVLIDASISNIPDILRKLRHEEDEQRQLSQTHEQDLDLERFLLIIAYAYEGRPAAAMNFWDDPESNLAGFLQWASKRASTPLVSAFCEMLQSLADNERCATAAHMFLSDEGHHASGKMKRTQSLTWNQIFKEIEFFTQKLRERPNPAQSHVHRAQKPGSELMEAEPESAMMLECYLRLIAKLCSESPVARAKLMTDEEVDLVPTLFTLASSPIPTRLRAAIFHVLNSFLKEKDELVNYVMWEFLDNWLTGGYSLPPATPRTFAVAQDAKSTMKAILNEISDGFEEPNAFTQLLHELFTPPDYGQLNDKLAFPESLGSSSRMPGIELYVDYVLGEVFARKSKELTDPTQLRILRLNCLDFAMTCLMSFNEDLIILGNEASNVQIDKAISTKDLATYVRLHPFARVMDWMFNDNVVNGLINTIHQDRIAMGNAATDSPLILSVQRAIEVMIKVLDLQSTYLNLVRPLIKSHAGLRGSSVANTSYSCFEDGIVNHLTLVADLGRYCSLGHPNLTRGCLKLLEKISTSTKILSAWNPSVGRHGQRNKAIVQLERDGQGQTIAASLSTEITAMIDPAWENDTNYSIKLFILDFLYGCLKASPDQPTIAHLLLGFRCDISGLSVEAQGPFDSQKSLFHNLLNVFIGLDVFQDELGMRGYLITLKHKILRIFQILWSSPLSAPLVMEELRATNFLFHMLLHEIQINPQLRWDGLEANSPEFLLTPAAVSYVDFLATRAMEFEYVAKELCSVSQKRIPATKRQIFDALNGQVKADNNEPLNIPNIFDFFDFLNLDNQWDIPPPEFVYYKDLDLSACVEDDSAAGPQYNAHKVQEIIWLKRNESRDSNNTALIAPQDLAPIEREESILLEYVVYSNQLRRFGAYRLRLLRAWTNVLLVMIESNDFRGTAKMSFLLQALQAILPSLEAFSSLSPAEAFELARIAKVLLFKLDLADDSNAVSGQVDKDGRAIGSLISDKLFQLFQVCLGSIGKGGAGSAAELRALYYSICYRYLTGVVDKATSDASASAVVSRHRTLKAIQSYGERLLNVICDDSYGSDPACQTAATILLTALVHIDSGRLSSSPHASPAGRGRSGSPGFERSSIIESLNRLNFIGVLVDSLKTVLDDWLAIIRETSGPNNKNSEASQQEQVARAKLALLLQLCQTRDGAAYVLQANLFHVLEVSRVFTTDPELEINEHQHDILNSGGNVATALERLYVLLVTLARIVSAAVLVRGSHNVLQGRRFLARARGLVVHTLKRSAGIGSALGGTGFGASTMNGNGSRYGASASVAAANGTGAGGADMKAQLALEERIEELAEAFMLLITATGYLEVSLFCPLSSFLFAVMTKCAVGWLLTTWLFTKQFEAESLNAPGTEAPRVHTTLFH